MDVSLVSHLLRERQLRYASVDFTPHLASTNARAAHLRAPWVVVATDHQTAGRGRLTRGWEVPDRAALTMSVLVPVARGGQSLGNLGWIPLLTGLAMAEAIADLTGLRATLKWPNDVLLLDDDGRKVCGILCELVGLDVGVVIGTGVNVDQTREELPIERATSLAVCGARVSREELLAGYLERLQHRYASWAGGPGPAGAGEGPGSLALAYRRACSTIGTRVDVHVPAGQVVRGLATGVDDDGRLVVAVDGEAEPGVFAAGDVVHVRPGGGLAGTQERSRNDRSV